MERVTEVLQQVILENVLRNPCGADETSSNHIQVLITTERNDVLLDTRLLEITSSTLRCLNIRERERCH